MEVLEFFKALGVMILIVTLVAGIGYWIVVLLRKTAPNLKYQAKYQLFKKKYPEEDVKWLMSYLKEGVSEQDLFRTILLTKVTTIDEAKELLYIYGELKKLKGGKKKQ